MNNENEEYETVLVPKGGYHIPSDIAKAVRECIKRDLDEQVAKILVKGGRKATPEEVAQHEHARISEASRPIGGWSA